MRSKTKFKTPRSWSPSQAASRQLATKLAKRLSKTSWKPQWSIYKQYSLNWILRGLQGLKKNQLSKKSYRWPSSWNNFKLRRRTHLIGINTTCPWTSPKAQWFKVAPSASITPHSNLLLPIFSWRQMLPRCLKIWLLLPSLFLTMEADKVTQKKLEV